MSDHECQVAKGMRWGILIVKRGGGGGGRSGDLPRENFIILEVHVCDFNVLGFTITRNDDNHNSQT